MKPYRGKRIDNGEWVYGWYMEHPFKDDPSKPVSVIVQDERPYEVDPETVGQFVCKDKNDKDVFADDKIKALYTWPDTRNSQPITGKVGWREETFNWVLYHTPNTPECVDLWQLFDIELIEEEK